MKITILGTANGWGPNPFLDPPPRWPMTGTLADGTVVPFRRFRTSLLVESADGKRLLVDCSADLAHQIREFRLGVLDAIAITHPHPDHSNGLDDLSLYRPSACLPIPIHATSACWEHLTLKRGFAYVVEPRRLVTPRLVEDGESFEVGSVSVTAVAVEHNPLAPGAVGFVFEERGRGGLRHAIYTGDFWAFANPECGLLRRPFDVAIIECDRWTGRVGSGVGGGHMSFEEALRMMENGPLSRPRPRQAVFVHFGDRGPVGTASGYADWRSHALAVIEARGLMDLAANTDAVIAYDGLVLGG